ncbi:MAG: tetratricopeptide repeat protein [Calditrichaeota bacterium]|nr:MAG: tetratricopeptide repeat protein [Calditrichota bacterium]
MKVCPKCQAENYPIDNFCGSCGFKFEALGNGLGLTQKELKAADIKTNLGLVYYNMGKYDSALEVLEKVLESDPENHQAFALKNRILNEKDDIYKTE